MQGPSFESLLTNFEVIVVFEAAGAVVEIRDEDLPFSQLISLINKPIKNQKWQLKLASFVYSN